jgi:hypothetical protein
MSVIEAFKSDKAAQTPTVVLQRVAAERPKAVVVMVLDEKNVWDFQSSEMTIADLCAAEKWMSVWVADLMRSSGD